MSYSIERAHQILSAFRKLAQTQAATNAEREAAQSLVLLSTLPEAVFAANSYMLESDKNKPGDATVKGIRTAVYRVPIDLNDKDRRPYTLKWNKAEKVFELGRADPKARKMPEQKDLEMVLREVLSKFDPKTVRRMVDVLTPQYKRPRKVGAVMKSQSLKLAA